MKTEEWVVALGIIRQVTWAGERWWSGIGVLELLVLEAQQLPVMAMSRVKPQASVPERQVREVTLTVCWVMD